jgi:hypothetical protein
MKLPKMSNGFIVFIIWLGVIAAMILAKMFIFK